MAGCWRGEMESGEECVKGGGQKTCTYLWLLPVAFFVISIGGFLTTFTVGVSWENISPFFPFISETGEAVPENFIFAFVMNTCAFLGAIIYLMRFMLLQEWVQRNPLTRPSCQGLFRIGNQFSLLSALIACFGVAMVGNIEDHTIALTCIFFEWFTVTVFSLWMVTVALEFRRFAVPLPTFTPIISILRDDSFQEKREGMAGTSEEGTQMVHITTESELI